MYYSKHNMLCYAGSKDGMVKLWNLDISDLIANLEGHSAPITCVAIAAQEAFAVSGSRDKTVKVWSIMMSIVITDYKVCTISIFHTNYYHCKL